MQKSPGLLISEHIRPFVMQRHKEVLQHVPVDFTSYPQSIGSDFLVDDSDLIEEHCEHQLLCGSLLSWFFRAFFPCFQPVLRCPFALRIPGPDPRFIFHHDVMNGVHPPAQHRQRLPGHCHSPILLCLCEQVGHPFGTFLRHLQVLVHKLVGGSLGNVEESAQSVQGCPSVSVQDVRSFLNLGCSVFLGSSRSQLVLQIVSCQIPVEPPVDTCQAESISAMNQLQLVCNGDLIHARFLHESNFDALLFLCGLHLAR